MIQNTLKQPDPNSFSALQHASLSNVLELLLNAGARIDQVSHKADTPITLARKSTYPGISERLESISMPFLPDSTPARRFDDLNDITAFFSTIPFDLTVLNKARTEVLCSLTQSRQFELMELVQGDPRILKFRGHYRSQYESEWFKSKSRISEAVLSGAPLTWEEVVANAKSNSETRTAKVLRTMGVAESKAAVSASTHGVYATTAGLGSAESYRDSRKTAPDDSSTTCCGAGAGGPGR